MEREKGLHRDEDDEEDPYKVKRGLHTNKTEGDMRGGVLEDRVDESWLKMNTMK